MNIYGVDRSVLSTSVHVLLVEGGKDEPKNENTHQLNKRQSSIAVGHDEDILGCGAGHKVVPHVQHMVL